MNKATIKTRAPTIQFKDLDSVGKVKMIGGVVDAYLASLVSEDSAKGVLDKAKTALEEASSGQLGALQKALASYEDVITESIWNECYAANTREKLGEAKNERGGLRYLNKASRDVTVNMLKVATMGLTLARFDATYAPSWNNSSNIKKYATDTREKLQRDIDPETKMPRLQSGPKKAKEYRKLPEGKLYYLFGCETDKGLAGANSVVAASSDFSRVRNHAERLGNKYKRYIFVTGEPIEYELAEEVAAEPEIVNSAVVSNALSSVEQ